MYLKPTSNFKRLCMLQAISTFNVHAVAKRIATNDPARQEELIEAARECVLPGLSYLRRRFSHQDGDLFYLTQVYCAVRLGNPNFVHG